MEPKHEVLYGLLRVFSSYVCVILEANEGISALDGICSNLSALVQKQLLHSK